MKDKLIEFEGELHKPKNRRSSLIVDIVILIIASVELFDSINKNHAAAASATTAVVCLMIYSIFRPFINKLK